MGVDAKNFSNKGGSPSPLLPIQCQLVDLPILQTSLPTKLRLKQKPRFDFYVLDKGSRKILLSVFVFA